MVASLEDRPPVMEGVSAWTVSEKAGGGGLLFAAFRDNVIAAVSL